MTTAAAVVACLFGALVAGFGLWGVVRPRSLQAWIETIPDHPRFALAVVSRAVFGAALLVAAPHSRFPAPLQVLGGLALIASLALALAGPERLKSLVRWWCARSAATIRVWSGFAALLGAAILYALL